MGRRSRPGSVSPSSSAELDAIVIIHTRPGCCSAAGSTGEGSVGMESLTSGTLAGTGTFRCEICGHVLEMATADVLPACPGCDGASFTRASLFAGTGRFQRAEPETPTHGDAIDAARDAISRHRPLPRLPRRRRDAHGRHARRLDAHRTQPVCASALRGPDRLAPPRRAHRRGRGRPRARRPQPQRRLRQRRAHGLAAARRRRRDRHRPLPPALRRSLGARTPKTAATPLAAE